MFDDESESEIEPEPLPIDGDDLSVSYSEYLAGLPPEVREAIERATGKWGREDAERRWREGNGAAKPFLPS